jgi:hypothetical protein
MGAQGAPGGNGYAPYDDGVSLNKDIIHSFLTPDPLTGTIILSPHSKNSGSGQWGANITKPKENVISLHEGTRIILISNAQGQWSTVNKVTFRVGYTCLYLYDFNTSHVITSGDISVGITWGSFANNLSTTDAPAIEFVLVKPSSQSFTFIPVGTPKGSGGGGSFDGDFVEPTFYDENDSKNVTVLPATTPETSPNAWNTYRYSVYDQIFVPPYTERAGTITPWMEFDDGHKGFAFVGSESPEEDAQHPDSVDWSQFNFFQSLVVSGYEVAKYSSEADYAFFPVVVARTCAGSIPFICLPKTIVKDWPGITFRKEPTDPGETEPKEPK